MNRKHGIGCRLRLSIRNNSLALAATASLLFTLPQPAAAQADASGPRIRNFPRAAAAPERPGGALLAQNAPEAKKAGAPAGNAPAGAQAPPAQAQPAQQPPGQAQPGQQVPGQAQPGQQPPGQAVPGQQPPGQAQPGQALPVTRNGQNGQAQPGGEERIEPTPGLKGQTVSISAANIPLKEFLRFLAAYTGLPVLFDSQDQILTTKEIQILSDLNNVTEEVIKLILEVNKVRVLREKLKDGSEVIKVESMQLTQQPGSDDVRPVPVLNVEEYLRQKAMRVEPPDQDQLATMVFTLKDVTPQAAIEALQSLISGGGGGAVTPGAAAVRRLSSTLSMVEVRNTQMLIITAKFGLLDYLQKLLGLIDIPFPEPERIIRIIQIEWADAEELSNLIGQFIQAGQGGGLGRFGVLGQRQVTSRLPQAPQPGTQAGALPGITGQLDFSTQLIPEFRTNKIIVKTFTPQDLQDIEMLINELDVRFDIRRLRTHIYQVRYLKAIEVAQDLQLLIQGAGTTGGLSGLSRGAGGAGRTGLGRRTGIGGGIPRAGGGIPGGIGAGTPQPGTGAAANAPIPSLIVPHEPTNSLLIQAEPEEYDEILNILSKIDTKRRQVFLEAALVQVQSNSSLNYAIELIAGNPDDRATRGIFATIFGLTGIDFETADRILPDLSDPASLPPGAIFALQRRGKLPAIVRFFKSNSDSQILATPFILADDNEENRIDILETRFVVNSVTQANQTTLQSQTGEPAGITLSITPTISGSEKAVFLTMDLSVSEFQEAVSQATLPPKNENTMTSSVTIPDGEVFVVGGLTRENKSKSVQKVPILGDLPIVGKLFRSESTVQSQNNLYVFLQAHILTDEDFRDGVHLTGQAEEIMSGFDPTLRPIRFERPPVERRRRTIEDEEERLQDLNQPRSTRYPYDPYSPNFGAGSAGSQGQREPQRTPDYNRDSGSGARPPAAPPSAPAASGQRAPVESGGRAPARTADWFDTPSSTRPEAPSPRTAPGTAPGTAPETPPAQGAKTIDWFE